VHQHYSENYDGYTIGIHARAVENYVPERAPRLCCGEY